MYVSMLYVFELVRFSKALHFNFILRLIRSLVTYVYEYVSRAEVYSR